MWMIGFGRRNVFVYAFWVFIALSLLSAFVADYWQLLVVRALLGVAIGADIAASITFLAELAPRRSRGGWTGAMPQVAWSLGALASLGVALLFYGLVGQQAWRWILALGALPALVVILGRKGLPESPRWLLSKGRAAEAQAAMALFGIDPPPDTREEGPPVGDGAGAAGSYAEIFRFPHTRRALLALVIIALTPLISPASVVAPYVLRYVGLLGDTAALKGGMLIWVGGLLGALLAYGTIDRIGRLRSVVIACWGCTLCLVLLVNLVGQPVLFVTAYVMLGVLTWFGASSFWTLPTELLPTRLRARAQGLGNGLARTVVGLTTWLVPWAIASFGFPATFYALAALGVLLGCYALTGMRFEPMGRDLGEVAAERAAGGPA